MSEPLYQFSFAPELPAPPKPKQRWVLHISLFVLTFITCVMAGVMWTMRDPYEVENWRFGFTYAILLLLFLSSHEFGHYFAARIHKVDATLPFYIPMPAILSPFGTLGAVIRTRSQVPSRKVMFDIGVAGPISGFIVCLGILIWGLTHLPPKEYLYSIHPYLQGMEHVPPFGLTFGNTLLYWLCAKIFVPAGAFLPPMNEMYHYPFLCVGWFGLFVTSLNLLPIGQLDGGHLTFGLFGKWHLAISRAFFYVMLALGVLGLYDYFVLEGYIAGHPLWIGWSGWLFWAAMVRFIIKLQHPPVPDMSPLDRRRKIIGWVTIVIFVLSFTPLGIYEIPVDFGSPQQEQRQEQQPDKDKGVPVMLKQSFHVKTTPVSYERIRYQANTPALRR